MDIIITSDVTRANAITHSGSFHADEVMATVILGKVFGKIRVCRTNKLPDYVSSSTIIYDIGFGKYDHHQKGGNGTRKNGVPYASCGLIWRDFGYKLLEKTCNPDFIWAQIDRDLIQGIDAVDTGSMPRTIYPIQSMNISHEIGMFNPRWDGNESTDDCFLKAVRFAEIVFDATLEDAISKANAQGYINEAIENSKNNIMILKKFAPWKEFLFLSSNPKANDIQFVISPSLRGGFCWHGVPVKYTKKDLRKTVPENWKGKYGELLQQITGIPTANFCHPDGFIGGAQTLEDTIKMVELSINS